MELNSVNSAYEQATSLNPIYTDNATNWKFLYDAYCGGKEWQNGGYLTKYQLETESEYKLRALTTPLDNQCRSIVSTYISFLFRTEPERDLGSVGLDPTIEGFLEDADREGRSLDSFIKQASIWANVFGHSWMLLVKPDVGAITRADEMAQDVRPYLNLLTPIAVMDWAWTRKVNGAYELTRFKYLEDINGSISVIKEWTPEFIITHTVDTERESYVGQEIVPNGLNRIPAVILYSNTSAVRGIGLSTIEDIAHAQKFIYNMTSEAEQAVRLGSHPSLVKTEATQAGAGAGSIIQMPENLDPNLKPYVLEFSGQEISSIYAAIDHTVSSIDKMANTGSIRASESRVMSGVSREVEFQLLNARLSEMADNIELAEEQLWQFYAAYQGTTWDGVITYPDSFSVRDVESDLNQLVKAQAAVTDPVAKQMIEHEILETVGIELTDMSAETATTEDTTTETTEESNTDSLE